MAVNPDASCNLEVNLLMCICSNILTISGLGQPGGRAVAVLEFTSKGSSVQVNSEKMEKNGSVRLTPGDEVIFGTSGKKYAYVSFLC